MWSIENDEGKISIESPQKTIITTSDIRVPIILIVTVTKWHGVTKPWERYSALQCARSNSIQFGTIKDRDE